MWNKSSHTFVVDQVEPFVEFWTKRFGFQTVISIPEGGSLGFVTLRRDGVELSYRSRASLVADIAEYENSPTQVTSILTIELGTVQEIVAKIDGLDAIVPRRRTFYGNNETIIRTTDGQIVVFSAPGDQPTML